MLRDEFDLLFEEYVAVPLRREGFERYRDRKSLIMTRRLSQLSLIRLGGRLARPGCMTQIICFRHTFLRPIEGDTPVDFTLETSDYPFKFLPREFSGLALSRPRYRPLNLGLKKVDRYCYENNTSEQVRRDLARLKGTIVKRVLPWFSQMTPEIAAKQIQAHGEEAWCEKRWLDDYEAQSRSAPN